MCTQPKTYNLNFPKTLTLFLQKLLFPSVNANLIHSSQSFFPLFCYFKTERDLDVSLIFLPLCSSVCLTQLQVFYDPRWTNAQKSDYLTNAQDVTSVQNKNAHLVSWTIVDKLHAVLRRK